ncbi:MAG: glutamate synthase large subunit [Oscillospiraceae bacterium]|nr:glutamate synthase large subunit [Oscillospiraceae bacterium]MDD4368299.1 glutamate synthase large subunit [Oscillospiraceae bacterium]
MSSHQTQPAMQATLYSPSFEHDACGIGALAHIKGQKSHQLLQDALSVLINMEHRGGKGLERNTGDGAGVLFQLPHRFLRIVAQHHGHILPEAGAYGVAMIFFPQSDARRELTMRLFEEACQAVGVPFLFWRKVPTYAAELGATALASMPQIYQAFLLRPADVEDEDNFERRLYVLRRVIEKRVLQDEDLQEEIFYICSMSCRTIVYKGMLLATQLKTFYPDLDNAKVETALALVHSRYSTNTVPSWERAHPNRYIIHNGEINTLRGNINWMHAREAKLYSRTLGADLKKVLPVIDKEGSDSAILDNVLEFLTLSGRDLARSAMMLIPEPWVSNPELSPKLRDFLAYQSTLMEPWDGPAAIAFTDGQRLGALLDRNGLRPARYVVTKDDRLILASEVGVLDLEPQNVLIKGNLKPGKMLVVDPAQGRIIWNDEIKEGFAGEKPYSEWMEAELLTMSKLDAVSAEAEELEAPAYRGHDLLSRQKAFGYAYEDVQDVVIPMAQTATEPINAMGADQPLAVLSKRPKSLFSYFKQLFAQVTNPPLDAIREELVTATQVYLGTRGNLLEDSRSNCRLLRLKTPVMTRQEFVRVRDIKQRGFKAQVFDATFDRTLTDGLHQAVERLMKETATAVAGGTNIIIISDRGLSPQRAPIPSLLALSAVHQNLIREGLRTLADLVMETGEAREVHHFAMLVGYGAAAIYPYLLHDTLRELCESGRLQLTPQEAIDRYDDAVVHGIVKIMSKMGISTVHSYEGSQIFEAVGINDQVIDRYFTNTTSRIGGLGLPELEAEARAKHDRYLESLRFRHDTQLESNGEVKFRTGKEEHLYDPMTVYLLQQAVRAGDYQLFKTYTKRFNEHEITATLRSLLDIVTPSDRTPLPLEAVEPAREIVKRFKTGAMSYGSISKEAHETLAIAMNRLGGKSNTGEGGEDPAREIPDENGDSRLSAIKQVASGRFGVTSRYLNSAKEIQIKMAQGAKPGEGGQLPGRKVYPWIAEVRRSTPGVGLISPPPHHDIYSIEDLAELIYDLKNANDRARVTVKLVSETGVGTIAAGVAKGGADTILISGHDGGTGAAPRSSVQHTGLPLELGLAETQQTLVRNGLRSRVRLEADGKLMTGRDVAIACLLGAEEFGFATAPLVAIGCIMMRVCNLDTCPVGIATQNKRLRACFSGKPEYVENFMLFVAEEMREYMAQLGFATVEEMCGHVECLQQIAPVNNPKAATVDLSRLLAKAEIEFSRHIAGAALPHFSPEMAFNHELEKTLDETLFLPWCEQALKMHQPIHFKADISNVDRTVGTILGSRLTRLYPEGMADDTIRIDCLGSGGQSFGAFCPRGLTLSVTGDANDYFGKGLSGGKLAVHPPEQVTYIASENIIIGNVALYGATGGKAFINGLAGERFAVRNSGAEAVVEGVGNHGCEYMTGGLVVVLGPVGVNFAAGMSGGLAYVYDETDELDEKLNHQMVELADLDDLDWIRLKQLLEEHIRMTDSSKAIRIMYNIEQERQRFRKVVPREYAKVLALIAEQEGQGMTHDQAVEAAFNRIIGA